MTTKFGHAINAINRGLHVFPVQDGEKLPHLVDDRGPYRIKWPKYATNDLVTASAYWRHWPNANIGVACKPSRILVLDADMPKTGRETKGTRFEHLMNLPGHVDGTDILREICEQRGQSYDDLLGTYSVQTTRFGLHLYFHWPDGAQASQASLLPGLLDIRSNGGTDGGYVLAAGSETQRGPYLVETDAPIVDCPPWLVELCTQRHDTRKADELPFRRALSGNTQGLADKIACAAEGNRNATLLWAACAAAVDGIPLEQAIEDLSPAARRAGLGDYETRATIQSGYRMKGKG